MIKVNMFSKAGSVKGHGVLSAYEELISMLENKTSQELQIEINDYSRSDISHYHTINFRYYLSSFFKNKRGVKVCHVHFLPQTLEGSLKIPGVFRKLIAAYITSFYKRMDKLVVVNPSFKKELIDLGLQEEKIEYIPNFVSSSLFHEKSIEEKNKMREKLGMNENEFVVVGVGQIQKRKGIDDFIALAKKNPQVTFIWLGGFSFGRITDGYEKYKEIYENPPENVKFTGIIDRVELVDYYNAANLFLLPSYNELFPMSILEAFSCGLPVMVRDLSLYQEILSGYYLSFEELTDLNQKLNRCIKDSALLEEYKEKARDASKEFSEESLAETWLKFYNSLIK
jgi:1,2-diacylglycerol-3-alpha-glucose alpha-1,2-galactosyltransferase